MVGVDLKMWFLTVLTASVLLGVTFAEDFTWNVINDTSALCNDYTPAGYFVASGRTPEHWVIFLESGGGCYSPDTCNARYFNQNVRTQFEYSSSPSVGPLVTYDVLKAKSFFVSANEPLSAFVSPLVTSISTFQSTSYFKNGNISVQGQGILDDNCTNNPIFCNHTRVIIPYCSSDLWLANSPSLSCNISKDLYDKCYANTSSCAAIGETFFKNCFLNSTNQLSFVFRGQAIYRGALQQLLEEGLAESLSVTLVGSSAGGVGVINHANWTLQLLQNWTEEANLSVVADSSWFINFQDVVYKLFVGIEGGGISTAQKGGVFSIITATDTTSVTCTDTTRGTPCCFSAFCMLNTPEYYPSKDVSTFMLFGLYDVYLLADSLIGLDISKVGQKNEGAGLTVKFIEIVSEYGGAMNDSLSVTSRGVERLSYYVTECFQHIYLVTSTLWGEGKLFGNEAVDIMSSFASYSQFMNPDTWYTMRVGTNKTSIRDALRQWYPNRYSSVVTIRDSCSGPRCNPMCPEQIDLGASSGNIWPTSSKIALLVIVGAIGVLCVLVKAIFLVWVCSVERFQHLYLTKLLTNSSDVDEKLKFPVCEPDNYISVSCLNLSYSVTVKAKKVKDEKKDETTPIVLGDLSEPAIDEDNREFGGGSSKYMRLISDSVEKQKRKSVVEIFTHDPTVVDDEHNITTCYGAYTKKQILNGISIYFNPGQLTGIMGPSGCGKTTFLDLLTGRRKTGNIKGDVYVNGLPIEQIKNWYIANTGYVLQLATPYYEELTVRENLTLAAQIKLPSNFSWKERFTRIEQVLAVSELLPFAETVVGKATGPGLSGGQKRRLAIALQLLKLPSVLFLDEPTSGLDATSSYELLTHLNRLADSKRTIILTIHQPRLEIFHLFDYLLLLSDGKIAYHGAPERAYEVFVQALRTSYNAKGFVIPQLEDHNPADVIMDMLGNPEHRAILTDFFNMSEEPQEIRHVILDSVEKSTNKLRKKLSKKSFSVESYIKFAVYGAEKVKGRHGNAFNRLAALEARCQKRASFGQMLYLPAIFFAYGVLLGSVYYQSQSPLLVMSGFCVYSVASALFMFPALYLYYQRALEVYTYEHADGVGSPWDIVIQGFIRGIILGFFPVIMCASVLYLLLVNAESYNFKIFGQVLLVNLALNQTWVALLIFVICAFPKIAFRLSPIISSVAGFTSGFFVPRESMPVYYRWLFYINPNYYGFSASANLLVNSLQTGCVGSVFECYPSSPQYYLKYFNFDDINPYENITILLSFTVFYLVLAVFSNWFRYTTAFQKSSRFFFLLALFFKNDPHSAGDCDQPDQGGVHPDKGGAHPDKSGVHPDKGGVHPDKSGVHPDKGDVRRDQAGTMNVVEDDGSTNLVITNEGVVKFSISKDKVFEMQKEEEEEEKKVKRSTRRSIFLREGEGHKVHVPVVAMQDEGRQEGEENPAERKRKVSVWERQKTLYRRVQAVMEVMREVDIEDELSDNEDEEGVGDLPNKGEGDTRSRDLWKQAAKTVVSKMSVVSELKRKSKKAKEDIHSFHHAVSTLMLQNEDPLAMEAGPAITRRSTINKISRQISGQLASHKPCLVPKAKWKQLVKRATEGEVDLQSKNSAATCGLSLSMDDAREAEKVFDKNLLSSSQVVVVATIESEGTCSHSEGTHPQNKGTHLHSEGAYLHSNATETSKHPLVKEDHIDDVEAL